MAKRQLKTLAAVLLTLTMVFASFIPTFAVETNDTYVVVGTENLTGYTWVGVAADAPENVMTKNSNGNYEKVFTNVLVGNNYQFKIVKNDSEWIGVGDTGNDKFTFNVTEDCDVTVTYNPTTNEITATGDGVVIPTDLDIDYITAVGNGEDAWLNGKAWVVDADENIMAETSEGSKVYQIKYENLDAYMNYQFKFAANGSWTYNWGLPYQDNVPLNEWFDLTYDGQNMVIDTESAGYDAVLTLDLSNFNYSTKKGAKGKVDIITVDQPVETTVEPTTEPATVEPTTAEPTTVPATEPTTPSVTDTKIYFDTNNLPEEWGTTKSVFCHLYSVAGDDTLAETSWQGKAEKCKKDTETGLYYYDTAMRKSYDGTNHGGLKENADYALVFSTIDSKSLGHQTCNITLGKACLGDTVYLTGGKVENIYDSQKLDYIANWKNNSNNYGPMAFITSLGNVIDGYYPVYLSRAEMVAQALYNWAVKNAKNYTAEAVANICAQVNAEPIDVYNSYAEMYATQLADPVTYPTCAPLTTIAELLGIDSPDPTEPAPAEDPIYVVAGLEYFAGVAWVGDPTLAPENVMTKDGEVFTKTFPATKSGENYQLKVVKNNPDGSQNWIGYENTDKNLTFNVTADCDVTVTYNPATNEINVTGEYVDIVKDLDIDYITVVGNGYENWLNDVNWGVDSDKNTMVEVADKIYKISYTNVTSSDSYRFKFTANGSWADNWGLAEQGYVPLNEWFDLTYNGQNMIIDTDTPDYDDGYNLVLTLDLSNFNYSTKQGAKGKVDIITDDQPVETTVEPTTEPATVEPTTVSATEPTTPSVTDTKIYFDANNLPEEWGTTKTVFCHLYSVAGDDTLAETLWQSKSEKCKKDVATGLYYYDTATLKSYDGTNHGGLKENADYALVFSTIDSKSLGHQTCNITLGKACLGDTVYLTGGKVENIYDSQKLDYIANWKNNSNNYGPMAFITSLGNVIDGYYPVYLSRAEMVAQALYNWAVKNAKNYTAEAVANICAQVNAIPIDVYNSYAEMYATQLSDPVTYPTCAPLTTIAELLGLEHSSHSFTKIIYEKKATCTEDGYITYKCAYDGCEETKQEIIKATGHLYGLWKITKMPTCYNKGTITKTCLNCGNELSEEVDHLEHDYEKISTVPPTCVEKGYSVYKCTFCNDEKKEDYVDYSGHDYTAVSVIKPTCTEKGYTLYRCNVCGEETKDDYIDIIPHKYDIISQSEATCTDEGYIVQKCSVCQKLDFVIVPKIVHKTFVNNFYCDKCGGMIESSHNGTDETYSTWILKYDNAKYISITFSEDSGIAQDDDYIYILDKDSNILAELTGSEFAGKTYTFKCDILYISKASANPFTGYGFKITYATTNCGSIGDVNFDNVIDIRDSTMIQRYLAKLNEFDDTQITLSDTDNDGRLTVKDATLLQKYIVNIPIESRIGTSTKIA